MTLHGVIGAFSRYIDGLLGTALYTTCLHDMSEF